MHTSVHPGTFSIGETAPTLIQRLPNRLRLFGANVMVVKTPAPQVLFLSFGESSLDFELRVWVSDANHRLKVRSELHQEIDRRFREANIEIAFPQRDLHVRSVDKSLMLRSPETAK